MLSCQVRNEPCNVRIACEYIANVKRLDVDVVAKMTSENALKLFPRLHEFMSQNRDS